ncbi:hypothetical protein NR402_12720 [Acidithiobacillus ferrooxidans]|jgi:hypothetical protein|uniref:hypothetical protein n=1 Tax=Acidithiobacillus ferrooxidans TaxID=920 RepID=UPI00214BE481|nr:hypothetical protein [Acidithiobacillus ferrooxidans]MCR2831139.1 hypothetical protein [Acidithiobacillus ferrooxidans]
MWHHAAAYAGHYHHPYYASHAVADHGGGWLMHTIVGGIIHGLIYGAIFRLFRGMSMGEALVVAVAGITLVAAGYWLWNRSRET